MEEYSRGAHTVCILHFRVGAGPNACLMDALRGGACRHGTRSGAGAAVP